MKTSEIDRFFEVLRRRWIVTAIVVVVGLALLPFVPKLIPTYSGTAELLIVSQALKDTTLSDPDLPSIITSTEVLNPVIKQLGLNMDATALAKKIKTKLPPKSSILELTYKDTNAEGAANVANAIADRAVAYFHTVATRGYSDVTSTLTNQIDQTRAKIASIDQRLEKASADSGFASSDKALDDLTSQLDDLRAQRAQITSSLAADRATADALNKQLADISPIVRGEILLRDAPFQSVQTSVAKDQADLVSQRASFRDSFPGLAALANRVGREQEAASAIADQAVKNGAGESSSYTQTVLDKERANAVVSADEQRLQATNVEMADEQSHLRDVASAGGSIGTLRAQRDATLQQYIALSQRLSSAQGDAAQAAPLGSLVVVSRAEPGRSSAPIYMILIAFGVLVLGLAAAFAVEALDRRFWGTREIETLYGRPVLLDVGGPA